MTDLSLVGREVLYAGMICVVMWISKDGSLMVNPLNEAYYLCIKPEQIGTICAHACGHCSQLYICENFT